MSTDKKRQHYVWAHHLRAWEVSRRLWCHWRKDRRLKPTNTHSIANEGFFYRVEELSVGDLAVVDALIRRGNSEKLRELNRGWVQSTQLTFALRRKLESAELGESERSKALDQLAFHERNSAENFHSNIETDFEQGLAALRRGETEFYFEQECRQRFIRFIAFQYFRTRKIREVLVGAAANFVGMLPPDHDPERTRLIETLIVSTNFGQSLVREGERYGLAILDNETAFPFITGDQPIINRLSIDENDVLLYFPVSPRRAVLYGPRDIIGVRRTISMLEVETLNHQMFRSAADQTYSNDRDYLAAVADVGLLNV